MKKGVPKVCSSRSTATERPGVSGTLAAAIGPSCRIVHRRFAEEDIGAILLQNLVDSVRIGVKPGPNRLHCHRFQRNFTQFCQDFSGSGESLARLGRIGYAPDRAVRHDEPRGTLNMDEEGIDLARQPGNLEPLSGQRAMLDGGAVVILDQTAGVWRAKAR